MQIRHTSIGDDVGMQACMTPVTRIKKEARAEFVTGDTKAYVDAVKRMNPSGGQSKAVVTSYNYYAAESIVFKVSSCQ